MYSFRDRVVPNLVVFLSGLAIMLVELVASRLVAKHLGSSLETWTTVIGVILAGMSLGSYWGGRLSDLRDPLRTLPLLLGGSSLLCLSLLVSNDLIGGSLGTSGLPQMARIVGTIGIMLFPPAFLLGTIQPTVARWAIHHASRTGSAIGNIGAWATIGNILGTFLTGFVLLIEFGVQSIVISSAALLAVTALAMWLLSSGSEPIASDRSRSAPSRTSQGADAALDDWWLRAVPNAFVFVSGMSIMVVELVGSRLLAREAGNSIYTWTSLIGVVLAGVATGNYLGGKLADRFDPTRLLPHLFVAASILTATLLKTDKWLGHPPADSWLTKLEMPTRILASVGMVFFLPPFALGTISPVVAKLALERALKAGRAIGNVYAFGAAGSIAGTFLTGFLMISLLGTKAVLCLVSGLLALISVCMVTSGLGHAVWAGVVMALSIAVMAPDSWQWAVRIGDEHMLGIRDQIRPDEYRLESNYYSIKVYPPDEDGSRTLVLDDLIHGYVVKDKPRELRYDYELIYASIMERAGAIPSPVETNSDAGPPTQTRPLRTLFIGGGSYTYPRYIEACYPGSSMLVAEIDPAVTRTAHEALYLPKDTPIETRWGDARSTIDSMLAHNARIDAGAAANPSKKYEFDFVFGDAFNDFSVPWHLTTREFNEKIKRLLAPKGVYMINIIDNYKHSKFLGAFVHTARQTFGDVEVFCTAKGGEPSESRETFVIAMSPEAIDFSDLGTQPGERPFEGLMFTPDHVETAVQRSYRSGRPVVLTDDYAPVENLLAEVARER